MTKAKRIRDLRAQGLSVPSIARLTHSTVQDVRRALARSGAPGKAPDVKNVIKLLDRLVAFYSTSRPAVGFAAVELRTLLQEAHDETSVAGSPPSNSKQRGAHDGSKQPRDIYAYTEDDLNKAREINFYRHGGLGDYFQDQETAQQIADSRNSKSKLPGA